MEILNHFRNKRCSLDPNPSRTEIMVSVSSFTDISRRPIPIDVNLTLVSVNRRNIGGQINVRIVRNFCEIARQPNRGLSVLPDSNVA